MANRLSTNPPQVQSPDYSKIPFPEETKKKDANLAKAIENFTHAVSEGTKNVTRATKFAADATQEMRQDLFHSKSEIATTIGMALGGPLGGYLAEKIASNAKLQQKISEVSKNSITSAIDTIKNIRYKKQPSDKNIILSSQGEARLPRAAKGGIVKKTGAAIVHRNEVIQPKENVQRTIIELKGIRELQGQQVSVLGNLQESMNQMNQSLTVQGEKSGVGWMAFDIFGAPIFKGMYADQIVKDRNPFVTMNSALIQIYRWQRLYGELQKSQLNELIKLQGGTQYDVKGKRGVMFEWWAANSKKLSSKLAQKYGRIGKIVAGGLNLASMDMETFTHSIRDTMTGVLNKTLPTPKELKKEKKSFETYKKEKRRKPLTKEEKSEEKKFEKELKKRKGEGGKFLTKEEKDTERENREREKWEKSQPKSTIGETVSSLWKITKGILGAGVTTGFGKAAGKDSEGKPKPLDYSQHFPSEDKESRSKPLKYTEEFKPKEAIVHEGDYNVSKESSKKMVNILTIISDILSDSKTIQEETKKIIKDEADESQRQYDAEDERRVKREAKEKKEQAKKEFWDKLQKKKEKGGKGEKEKGGFLETLIKSGIVYKLGIISKILPVLGIAAAGAAGVGAGIGINALSKKLTGKTETEHIGDAAAWAFGTRKKERKDNFKERLEKRDAGLKNMIPGTKLTKEELETANDIKIKRNLNSKRLIEEAQKKKLSNTTSTVQKAAKPSIPGPYKKGSDKISESKISEIIDQAKKEEGDKGTRGEEIAKLAKEFGAKNVLILLDADPKISIENLKKTLQQSEKSISPKPITVVAKEAKPEIIPETSPINETAKQVSPKSINVVAKEAIEQPKSAELKPTIPITENAKQVIAQEKEFISKHGKSTDTVPAMLTPGEFVVPKNTTNEIASGNPSALTQTGEQIKSEFSKGGLVKGYAEGGIVQGVEGGIAGGVSSTVNKAYDETKEEVKNAPKSFWNAITDTIQVQDVIDVASGKKKPEQLLKQKGKQIARKAAPKTYQKVTSTLGTIEDVKSGRLEKRIKKFPEQEYNKLKRAKLKDIGKVVKNIPKDATRTLPSGVQKSIRDVQNAKAKAERDEKNRIRKLERDAKRSERQSKISIPKLSKQQQEQADLAKQRNPTQIATDDFKKLDEQRKIKEKSRGGIEATLKDKEQEWDPREWKEEAEYSRNIRDDIEAVAYQNKAKQSSSTQKLSREESLRKLEQSSPGITKGTESTVNKYQKEAKIASDKAYNEGKNAYGSAELKRLDAQRKAKSIAESKQSSSTIEGAKQNEGSDVQNQLEVQKKVTQNAEKLRQKNDKINKENTTVVNNTAINNTNSSNSSQNSSQGGQVANNDFWKDLSMLVQGNYV